VENYGAELEMQFEPIAGFVPETVDGLILDLRFAWLQSEFIDFQNQTFLRNQFGDVFPVEEDFTGNRLPNSPRYTLSGAATWRFDLGRWGAITPRYDFAWTDGVYFDANNGQGAFGQDGTGILPENTIGQAAYVIHNARLSYQAPSGNMELSFWCRNFGDRVYKNFAFDASRFTSSIITFVGRPRTIGADLSFSF
jgi:iron complex outermembrane receptor protein